MMQQIQHGYTYKYILQEWPKGLCTINVCSFGKNRADR